MATKEEDRCAMIVTIADDAARMTDPGTPTTTREDRLVLRQALRDIRSIAAHR